MKKGKRLSRADGLNVLRDAYDLIRDEKENFMCLAIKSAGIMHGVGRGVSAIEMIPELDLFRPCGKSPGDAWFPIENRDERLRILKRLIIFYEKNRHDGIADGMIGRIRSFFNI
jgi:hypothetical protein